MMAISLKGHEPAPQESPFDKQGTRGHHVVFKQSITGRVFETEEFKVGGLLRALLNIVN
jgi:hypothetical protein